MTIHHILSKYWGFSKFRPLQEDIIQSVLDGNDTLALMPTGGGKSLCFQVPALLKPGICIVVSPLIALMKDQVENLKEKGIKAIAIISGMGKREVDIALDNCIYGDIKFLYLSPERLLSELVRVRIRHMQVNLIAIDEAHCISQWGYDFRPSYLHLTELREIHPKIPILALTATATEKVAADIQLKLNFKQAQIFRKSFERKNLSYLVYNEENKLRKLFSIAKNVKGTGIVYVRNRRETQEVARQLSIQGISADFYHAGLDTPLRMKKQTAWKNSEVKVIVANLMFVLWYILIFPKALKLIIRKPEGEEEMKKRLMLSCFIIIRMFFNLKIDLNSNILLLKKLNRFIIIWAIIISWHLVLEKAYRLNLTLLIFVVDLNSTHSEPYMLLNFWSMMNILP